MTQFEQTAEKFKHLQLNESDLVIAELFFNEGLELLPETPKNSKRCFDCKKIKHLKEFQKSDNAHLKKMETQKGYCFACKKCAKSK